MSDLEEVGEADQWRCWLCDEPVDPDMSVNDGRGPSIDSRITKRKAKKKSKNSLRPRLAHRSCNTGKGAVEPVVPWAAHLFVIDPAPIITSVERLGLKGGREAMTRCPTKADAEEAAEWLLDRVSRLAPDLALSTTIEPGGGQFLLILRAD